jgi:hypothetical protein
MGKAQNRIIRLSDVRLRYFSVKLRFNIYAEKTIFEVGSRYRALGVSTAAMDSRNPRAGFRCDENPAELRQPFKRKHGRCVRRFRAR